MKANLYPVLALDGIRKNKRFYLPYILTSIGTVTIVYIILYLAAMPTLYEIAGGRTMFSILTFGFYVVALFTLIFLFYTNSFLMKRRKKEFGLYNILGMGKKHLAILLLTETLILFLISVGIGLLSGILLSKAAEAFMVMLLSGDVTYSFRFDGKSLLYTVLTFIPIYALTYIDGLIKIHKTSAISLLHSESEGEKPPKGNLFFGIAGILILIGAYALALSIESPLAAIGTFFIAVCMVIVATYLIFISGSVVLCKLLQKNKRYYYKPNHFISVSSMAYRMKRNGAGLASICILCTTVLVIIMGAGSLYIGKDDSLNTRYPHDFSVWIKFSAASDGSGYTTEKQEYFYDKLTKVLSDYNCVPENKEMIISTTVTGLLNNDSLSLSQLEINSAVSTKLNNLTQITLIPLSIYNECMGETKTLAENEILIYGLRTNYDFPTLTLHDGTVLTIKETLSEIPRNGDAEMNTLPTMFIVTCDMTNLINIFNNELSLVSENYMCKIKIGYSFDTDLPEEDQTELYNAILYCVRNLDYGDDGFYSYSVECKAIEREDFYGTYGGIFFLGIFLSLLFLIATVSIIYYKQVTEGYEDESRFEIMQQVGMTRKDIRKSINSQMLTVFFLPLGMAVLHTFFAFPIVLKLLAMFNLENTSLALLVTSVAVIIFGIFYTIVYKLTSNAYCKIVGGKE